MTKPATIPASGIIPGPSLSDLFASPAFQKAKRKALAHDPLKGMRHIPKAPPSPNCGGKAAEAVCKKARFFADKTKELKHPPKLATAAKPKPSHGARPAKSAVASEGGDSTNVFNSPGFQKLRRKALSYDPLKGARHIPKAPPPLVARGGTPIRPTKMTKAPAKKPRIKAEPGLTASYVYTPGVGPQFQPAKVVKDRAQVSAMLREGQVGLFSPIAYCDPKGRTHTGTVVEIFSLLPV